MVENENRENTPQDLRAMLENAFADDGMGASAPENGVPEAVAADNGAASAEGAAPGEGGVGMPSSGTGADLGETAPMPEVSEQKNVQGTPPVNPVPSADNTSIAMQLAARAAESMKVLQEENARLRAAVQQQSAQAESAAQAVVEDTAPKMPVMPVFDASLSVYQDDEARKRASEEFTRQMAEYMRAQMASEIAPIRESFEAQRAAAEREAAIGALRNSNRMQGFDEALPQIERILEQMPALAAEKDAQKRYTMGYLISRGLEAVNAPAQRAAADIAKEAMENPEVMRLIEAERARTASEKNAAAVPQSASTGASTAPAVPQNRPQNMVEARTMLQKAFGL